MALTEEPFDGVQFACGLQTGLGTVNSTIAGLAASGLDSTDGVVLGSRAAGDAESGITLPTLARVGTERSLLANFTPQPSSFLRADVSGLQIAVLMQGNGVTCTPSAGQAKPLAGLDALWEASGLTGANGTSPTYVYTPAADSDYLTIKLWYADHTLVFQDCMANVEVVLTGGGNGVATFSFEVGSLYAQADGVTFPTDTDYTTQLSLAAPIVQKPTATEAHEWSTDRGVNTYTLTITNSLEKIPDSNQATGIRIIQASRDIQLAARMWVDSADTDFEYEELIRTTISTDTDWIQVGDPASATDTINAYKIEMETPELLSMKHDRVGTDLVVDAVLRAVGATAGSQFTLTFN